MGEPARVVVDGTLVQMCCAKCTKKVTAEAAAMAQKVRDAAFAAQSAKYPLKTCPVSGKELGADAVSTMFGTTLVKTCCAKCVATIEKDPAKYLDKLAPAAAPAKDAAGGKEGKEKEGKKDGGKDGEDCCAEPAAGDAKAGCCQDAKLGEKACCCQDGKATPKAGEKPGCCEEAKPAGAKTDGKPAEKKTDKPAAKEPEKKIG
jgi:hypothetical protein